MIGSMAYFVSHMIKNIKGNGDSINDAIVEKSCQPYNRPFVTPNCINNIPKVNAIAAAISNDSFVLYALVSFNVLQAHIVPKMPIGMFIKNIHLQLVYVIIKPPNTIPKMFPVAQTIEFMPYK